LVARFDVGFLSAILRFTIIHNFSVGFMSGELPGQASSGTPLILFDLVTTLTKDYKGVSYE